LLCLDLQFGGETEGSAPPIHSPDKFVYIPEDYATHTNVIYSIKIGRSPEKAYLSIRRISHPSHTPSPFYQLHFTVRAVIRNPKSDTLEVPNVII
jgi:hypothetical protein